MAEYNRLDRLFSSTSEELAASELTQTAFNVNHIAKARSKCELKTDRKSKIHNLSP